MKILASILLSIVLLLAFAFYGPAAVTQIGGLAVAQTGTKWNNLKDMAAGDGLASGVGMYSLCLFNGSTCDRQRGSIAGGADISIKSISGGNSDNTSNPTNKIPTLPCVVVDTLTPPAYTIGNIVPCGTQTNGATFIQQHGINFSTRGAGSMYPVQPLNLFNSQTTGAANTAVITTIAASANQRAYLYSIEAQCSAGTSTITIMDGGTTIFTSMGANVPAAPGTYRREWPTPLSGSTNTAMTITLAACGAANTGTLHVHAARV